MTLAPLRASWAQREAVAGFCSRPRMDWPANSKSTWRSLRLGVDFTAKEFSPRVTRVLRSSRACRQTERNTSSRAEDWFASAIFGACENMLFAEADPKSPDANTEIHPAQTAGWSRVGVPVIPLSK